MSLFQNWVIFGDYFGNKLPLPKITEQKKKADSTGTETADKIVNKDDSKNRALTMTPSFDGLFYIETMGQKEEKKKADSTGTETADKIVNKDDSKNRALTMTPSFDGLFYIETMGEKEEKKNADFKNTKTAETLNIGAGMDNVVAGGSKMKSRKKREIVFAPAFDGLFPCEMFISRDHASR